GVAGGRAGRRGGFPAAPWRTPSTCLLPCTSRPSATSSTWSSPTYTPSIISTLRSIALRSRPSHSAICFSVAATKATNRAATRASRDEVVGHRLQRPPIAGRRDADEHLLDGALVRRILGAERTPARQLEFATVERACARSPDVNAASAKHEFAGRGARAMRLARR